WFRLPIPKLKRRALVVQECGLRSTSARSACLRRLPNRARRPRPWPPRSVPESERYQAYGTILCRLGAKPQQTLPCFVQSLVAFREAEADLVRAVARIVVEAGSRHDADADIANQVRRELHVIAFAERSDVGHDVVSAVRGISCEAGRFQVRQEPV